MLVSRYCGFGILFGICQKLAIDQINKQDRGHVGGRINAFGFFNINIGFQAGQNLREGVFPDQIDKKVDQLAMILGVANSLFIPQFTIISGLAYIGVKILKVYYKGERNPNKRRQYLGIMDIIRLGCLGILAFGLLLPAALYEKPLK